VIFFLAAPGVRANVTAAGVLFAAVPAGRSSLSSNNGSPFVFGCTDFSIVLMAQNGIKKGRF
jgi:hypothetical protein